MGRSKTRAGPKIQYSNVPNRWQKKRIGYEAPIENFVFMARIFFPQKLMEIIQGLSKERNTPLNRLVVYAVFKEILSGNNFKNRDFKIPETVDNPDDHRENAEKIYKFIKNYRKEGIDIELAYFSMWDAGIATPKEWCEAYRVLLDTGAITEFRTTTKHKNYARKVKATDETGGVPLGTIINKT